MKGCSNTGILNLRRPFYLLSLILLIAFQKVSAQKVRVNDPYLAIHAQSGDPLYTTFTASMERSRLYGDKGYKMDYYSACSPLCFESDHAGKLCHIWRFNAVVVEKTDDYYRKPVVIASFPDMAVLEYEPWPGIEVQQTFLVYSSTMAMVYIAIHNSAGIPMTIDLYPVLEGLDSLRIMKYDTLNNAYILGHYETKKRLISNLRANYPYPEHMRDVLAAGIVPYSYGAYTGAFSNFYNQVKRDFYAEVNRHDSLNCVNTGPADYVSLHLRFTLKPGEGKSFAYFRGCQEETENPDKLFDQIRQLQLISPQVFIDHNEKLFAGLPRLTFTDDNRKLIYLSAMNLARGCMLPPAEKTSHNFYVFSRQPLWGWGHGHQVLHESLSMLAYVYLDPESAKESQRVYMEQQDSSGLIAYRHGPRGLQDYPHKGEPTTSAPFYNWINWEIYKASRDRKFLLEAFASGQRYANWLIQHRDTDGDGTFEWGPYGIIENVRDWYNAVFQVSAERYLDVDKEDISDELECLDLSLMMVKEMRCLSLMAVELGDESAAGEWKYKAEKTARLINERMWDPETKFYYSVNKKDHSFTFMTRDLRRQEIIAFLALWAGVATKERAETLLATLTDTSRFWRKYGVPTLSAKDDWYSPYVDYCCKWNGPVWLLWDYMVYRGLKDYGYHEQASELADKLILCVSGQLSRNHNFWESYSPDNEVLNCPPNYIWDCIIARILIEENN